MIPMSALQLHLAFNMASTIFRSRAIPRKVSDHLLIFCAHCQHTSSPQPDLQLQGARDRMYRGKYGRMTVMSAS